MPIIMNKQINDLKAKLEAMKRKNAQLFTKQEQKIQQKRMFLEAQNKRLKERLAKLQKPKETSTYYNVIVFYTFRVRMSFDDRQTWDVWKTHTLERMYQFKGTQEGIKKAIQHKLEVDYNREYPESEIWFNSELIKIYKYDFDVSDKFAKKVDFTKIRMKGGIYRYDFMPEIDNISFKSTNMMCVDECFEERYCRPDCRRPIKKGRFYELCNEFYKANKSVLYADETAPDLEKVSGRDTNMLSYVCSKLDISFMCFDINNKLMVKQITKCCNRSPFVIYNVGEHCYMVTDKDIIDSIMKSHASNHSATQVTNDEEPTKKIELPYYEWINYDELETLPISEDVTKAYGSLKTKKTRKLKAGYVIVEDHNLNGIFKRMVHQHNIIPFVRHKDKSSIQQIEYRRKDGYTLVIETDPNYSQVKNSVTWRHVQAMCGVLNVPFRNQGIGALVKEAYTNFTLPKREPIDRQAYYARQGEIKCACCGAIKSLQIDHIIPIKCGGTSDDFNLQLLCKSCHQLKSKREQEEGVYVTMSPISSSYNNQTKDIMYNIKKWAFNQKLSEDMPKYAYDMIKCRKNKLYYSKFAFPLFTVMDSPKEFGGVVKCGFFYVETQNTFPMRGNEWYSEPMVQYCLKRGIIRSENIKYELIPSITIPKDFFRKFIDYVYSTVNDEKLSKQLINSFIGCFYRTETTIVQGRYCKTFGDATHIFDGCKFACYNSDLGLYQVLTEKTITHEENEVPLYLQILDEEALSVHELAEIVDGACHVNTDCIYSTNYVDISEYEYEKGVPMYKKAAKVNPLTFKRYEAMDNYQNKQQFKLDKCEWEVIEHTGDATAIAQYIIKKNTSFSGIGRAGTGKSYMIQSLKEELEAAGNVYGTDYICLAPTNTAARKIGGETICKFCGLGGKKLSTDFIKKFKYIIVDEMSMVSELFYKLFFAIKELNPEVKLYMLGDFNQLLPVKDRVGEVDYENSRALYELCDGVRLTLTKCWRNDMKLFNLCLDVESVDKKQFGKEECKRSICFTNNMRKKVNDMWMRREAKYNRFITIKTNNMYSEDVQDELLVTKGMPVISRVNDKSNNILNNEIFKVVSFNKEVVTLNDNRIFEHAYFARFFNPAYCVTCHKAQGETIKEDYTIYEWNRFDTRLKYVALSRAKTTSQINII